MINHVTLFQDLESSEFKSNRMRKVIKAAFRENDISYDFEKLSNDGRIAHFIPPFKNSDVERAKAFEKIIVISAFYTEGERASCVSNYRNTEDLTKTTIYPNYLKAFQKADCILVPCQEYKDLLIRKGINKDKVLILSPGANVKIYKYLPETDMELTRRYYSINEDAKIILTFGNPKDKSLMKDLKELALIRKDCKFIFLATNKDTVDSVTSKFKRRFKTKLPPNVIMTTFKDINIYRSLFKNCRCLVYLNSILVDEIQMNEAMASEIQIIGYEKAFSKALIEKNIVLSRDNKKDLFTDICDYLDYKISGTISNATFYIEDLDVKYIGEKLKEIYEKLLMEAETDDRY